MNRINSENIRRMIIMHNKIRVIVAEDLEVLREYFVNIINESNDMRVVGEASNGSGVLKILNTIQADILLTDIEMDDRFDGISTAEKVKKQYPDINIVFLTVHEDDETIFGAYEIGAVDYVFKTASNTEIINSIQLAYVNKSPIRPQIARKIRSEFSRIRKTETNITEIIHIISMLTQSEREILRLLLNKKKVREIAKIRVVEISTVKSQINMILKKFKKKRTKQVIQLIDGLNIRHYFEDIL
jgi:DNA-binding NarL/FixJ family response regulator